MGPFTITFEGNKLEVRVQSENVFIVRIPEKMIHIVRRQDNEGASHWFEDGKDNETEQIQSLGETIDTYLQKNSGS
ncbi:hypothetical protein CLV51_106237 [Chitinophaga niastensis]|uniref:Uncharacterized protein n=1 Tax=Chitinophaga niastensis TaxID=536980 RepID=A0A2P8HDY2_CHINA|nr:hypothetical protein [Chitinophaga niastensis]PSL44371.1 hypothetical protein CLV51_106237 [Chitinophaga niastensis]